MSRVDLAMFSPRNDLARQVRAASRASLGDFVAADRLALQVVSQINRLPAEQAARVHDLQPGPVARLLR